MYNYSSEYIKEYEVQKFSELLFRIQKMYDDINEDNSELRKTIAEFNQEEEVQKWQAKCAHLSSHSLHNLSEKELQAYRSFRERHFGSCHNCDTFLVKLSGTGVGEMIEVICPICGDRKDITDIESW